MAQSADHKNCESMHQTDAQESSLQDSQCQNQTSDEIDSATGTDSTSVKAHAKKISNPSSPDGGEEKKTNINCDACGDKTTSYLQIKEGLCDICQRFFRISGPRIEKPTTSTATGQTEN